MTQSEQSLLDALIADLQAYKEKKDLLKAQIQNLNPLIQHHQDFINFQYELLIEGAERIKVVAYAKQACLDATFEKFFRAAHLKVFFGLVVDPTSL